MKKILSCLLVTALVLTTVFTVPLKAEAATKIDCTGKVYYVDTFQELKTAFETNGEDRTIILEKNIICTDEPSKNYIIKKTGADNIVFDFQGNQLKFKTTSTNSIFSIQGDGNVYFLDSANSDSAGIYLDFGSNASIPGMEPSIVYVNIGTAETFHTFGIDYVIGASDCGSADVINSDVSCANIYIDQGDMMISGGDIINHYYWGNGIAGAAPRSFDTSLDNVNILTGHSPVYFSDMSEIKLNIYTADLKSYDSDQLVITDVTNGAKTRYTKTLGESHISTDTPSVFFDQRWLLIDNAYLADAKGHVQYIFNRVDQSYLCDIIFPTGHLELNYETCGLDVVSKHSTTETTIKATPQKDGEVRTICNIAGCGMYMSEPIPKFSDIKLKYTLATYNGIAKTPAVVHVKDTAGKVLTAGTDYTVSYSNNVNAGTAVVTISGMGDLYTGSIDKTFKINPRKITAMSLSASSFVYNGNVRTPYITVKTANGIIASKITKDTAKVDVTYAAGRKNVGTYKVTVKGIGNYTGTLYKTFKINPKSTTIKSLTKAKSAFTVKWDKRTVQVTGYEVKYSTNSKFASGHKTVRIKSYNTVSKKITGLKSGKKYYVKVRTYKTVNGVNYYSAWSPVKYVTTK